MSQEASPTHFFRRIGARTFAASPSVEGAWNRTEQHIAPALGLIAHAVEDDLKRRRDDRLKIGRLSFDILGTIPIGTVAIDVSVLRPGRTIELVEARMTYGDRPVVLARAWLMKTFDTAAVGGTSFADIPPPEMMEPWDMSSVWAGACIGAMEVRRELREPGRATAWIRTLTDLLDGEATSATARTLAIADIANGIALRMSPDDVAFPNLDLTVHLFRSPAAGWLGMDTAVSFGPDGIGLTHSVLHDLDGAFGTVAQCLTVRPK